MHNDKFYRLLGLAARARKLAVGEGRAADSIKNKRANLVVISHDASENTKKKFKNSCTFYKADMIEYGDRFTLGRCIGKSFAVVMTVEDINMAKGLSDALKVDEEI